MKKAELNYDENDDHYILSCFDALHEFMESYEVGIQENPKYVKTVERYHEGYLSCVIFRNRHSFQAPVRLHQDLYIFRCYRSPDRMSLLKAGSWGSSIHP